MVRSLLKRSLSPGLKADRILLGVLLCSLSVAVVDPIMVIEVQTSLGLVQSNCINRVDKFVDSRKRCKRYKGSDFDATLGWACITVDWTACREVSALI
jgi:hypothetical protein